MGVQVLIGATALLVAGLAAGAAVEATPPRPVVAIEVRGDAPIAPDELEQLLAIEVGQPLDEERVRRTLLRISRSGRAAEAAVYARDEAGGRVAVVVLWADPQAAAVELAGELPLARDQLLALVPQVAGEPLREDRVLRGVYRLEEALRAEGYLDARVALAVGADGGRGGVAIVYTVSAGERWRVGELALDGLGDAVPRQEAIAALRAQPGEPLRSASVRDDPERLQRLLIRRGYRLARVEAATEQRHPESRTADLAYRVTLGPVVELELVGADRKQLERRDLLPFMGAAGYDEALLLQAVAQIRSDFQKRGHYRVQVDSEERREGDRLVVRLEVIPGPRFSLEELRFAGNETVPADQLGRRMATAPRRLLTPGSGRLVDEVLAADLSNLRSFYALEGYGEARVGPARVEEQGDRLSLTVEISEGPRRRVGELRLEGVERLDAEALRRDLPIAPGRPYHRVLVELALDQVKAAYERQGFGAALASANTEWNADRSLATVTIRVLEGQRTEIDAVLLRGLRRTRTDVVRRFVDLEPGEPLSTVRLLETQRQLYRLGIFSRVDVQVPRASPGGGAAEVVIQLEEGRTRSVAYGAGYDSETGARGLLRLSQQDLFGRAVSVGLDAIAGERNQLFRLLYRQPYLFTTRLELLGNLYREVEDRPAFDVLRRGSQVGLARQLGDLRLGATFDYRIVELESLDPDVDVPLESRNARVASLTPSVLYDRRDDPLDPRRGWSVSGQIERAAPLFDADAEFTKLFAQWTGYLDLRRFGVVAASLRGGSIENHRAATERGDQGIDLVPAAERFYAGGRTSHRAYSRDELGIASETLFVRGPERVVPLGGGALALGNFEYRFGIAGPVGGSLFVDVGQVWRSTSEVDLRQLRWGAGVGVRYLSPIGPLRLEIGWKLDREPYEAPSVWFISLGNPF